MFVAYDPALITLARVLNSLSIGGSLAVVGASVLLNRWSGKLIDRVSFRLKVLLSALAGCFAACQLFNQTAAEWALREFQATGRDGVLTTSPSTHQNEQRQLRDDRVTSIFDLLQTTTVAEGVSVFSAWVVLLGALLLLLFTVFLIFQSHLELHGTTERLDMLPRKMLQYRKNERFYWWSGASIAVGLSVLPLVVGRLGFDPLSGRAWFQAQFAHSGYALLWLWVSYGLWVVVVGSFALYSLIWSANFAHSYRHSATRAVNDAYMQAQKVLSPPSMRDSSPSFEIYKDYTYRFCLRRSERSSVMSGSFTNINMLSAYYATANSAMVYRFIFSLALYSLYPLVCFVLPIVHDTMQLWNLTAQPTGLTWVACVLSSSQGIWLLGVFLTDPILRKAWRAYRQDVYERQRARELAARHGMLLSNDVIQSPFTDRAESFVHIQSPTVSSAPSDHTVCEPSPTHSQGKLSWQSVGSLRSLWSAKSSPSTDRLDSAGLVRSHSLDTMVLAFPSATDPHDDPLPSTNPSCLSLPKEWKPPTVPANDSDDKNSFGIVSPQPPMNQFAQSQAVQPRCKPGLSCQILEWFALRRPNRASGQSVDRVIALHSSPSPDGPTTLANCAGPYSNATFGASRGQPRSPEPAINPRSISMVISQFSDPVAATTTDYMVDPPYWATLHVNYGPPHLV
ncbi:hypothetical protein H4R34_002183 [Dimargaris verticillata]|uniref:Uncharacterized protein n=1 Tax=Dimargaris verticillata TaxID=2761393 RepID=A0A9W8B8J7_9FUNG|nr:hypothetical protein H4R34_002183 [Dimargaris verticillata]